MADLLQIAVVGHTNTGKTSLLRTLTRDPGFGEVADSAGTTRQVQGARLRLEGRPVLAWFDTPGMEDSIALLEYIEHLCGDRRLDGPDRIRVFLESPEARRRFEQEARVLEKMLECDAALYVIDARDPVLGKHRDELALLAACGKPLLPVLNFVHAPSHRAMQWRDAMARLGLHALLEFDTVAPPLDGEKQLYDRLSILLDRHADILGRLSDALAGERRERHEAALRLIAELLVDVAALRLSCDADDAALQQATQRLRELARRREQACVDALLALYNFRPDDYARDPLPLAGERWGMDLFHPRALRDAGVEVGIGMATGAMAGAAVDLMLAGISLGTAALIGAAAGGMWQGIERFGKRLGGKLRGRRELSVDDAVLRLLAVRQRALVQALERRGHAAREPVRLAPADTDISRDAGSGGEPPRPGGAGKDPWRDAGLPDEIKEARSRPEWCGITEGFQDSGRRAAAVGALARQLG